MPNQIRPLATNCLILVAFYYFLTPPPALGYFDLGTGTYMVQMLLGFGAAIWLSMRTSWIRFGRKKKAVADNNQTPAAASASASQPDLQPGSPSAPDASSTGETASSEAKNKS
jgi:hypothetical protein